MRSRFLILLVSFFFFCILPVSSQNYFNKGDSLGYEVISNDASEKNISLGIGPYLFGIGEVNVGLGFILYPEIRVGKIVTLNGSFRNMFRTKPYSDNFYRNRFYYMYEGVLNIHLKDDFSIKDGQLPLESWTSGRTTTTRSLLGVPVGHRKTNALRAGCSYLRIPLDIPYSGDDPVYSVAGYPVCILGYSKIIQRYLSCNVENYGTRTLAFEALLFADLMYAPVNFSEVVETSFPIFLPDSHRGGFRIGARGNSLSGTGYGFSLEMGYYPCINSLEKLNDVYFDLSLYLVLSQTAGFLKPRNR